MSESSSLIRSGKSLLIGESAAAFNALDLECAAFTYYVIKQKPSDYVLLKYRQAHAIDDFVCTPETSLFDRLLISLSAKHPILIRLVDSYTSVFCRKALVRKKWILLLAILESCAPTYNCFESDHSSRKRFLIDMLGRGSVFLLTLCVSLVLLMPFQLILATHAKLFGRS